MLMCVASILPEVMVVSLVALGSVISILEVS